MPGTSPIVEQTTDVCDQVTPCRPQRRAGVIAQTADVCDHATNSVFSVERTLQQPTVDIPAGLEHNKPLVMDGRDFLALLQKNVYPVCFFDPQYRGVLNHLRYGNEGKERGKERSALPQMEEKSITAFIRDIHQVLLPSGHLFLWVDKYHLCQGIKHWLDGTSFDIVDMIVWDKQKMGMGYRSRRTSEYLLVLQKKPRRAKGVWKVHNILDVYSEKVSKNGHPHRKPCELQKQLILAVSNEGDVILDPAAGSFSVMDSARSVGRNFLGCDIRTWHA